MATQLSCENLYFNPEFEYQVEEMRKRLHDSVANIAQIRFKKAIQKRMSVVNDRKGLD